MNRGDALIAGLLSAGLVALLSPLASVGIDWMHDGIMLKPALDVLSGQVLFRDTFMQYGALSCYLQAAVLWLHPSLQAVRFLTVAAYGVTLLFLYASWRLILPRSLAILSCAMFILFIPAYEKGYWNDEYWLLLPWSSVFAMMFQSIGLYALLQVIRGGQPREWALLLGITVACVFWCRQPVGITTFGGLAVIWFAMYWSNWTPARHTRRLILVTALGGFVAVHALLLGGIAISGALPEWWYQNFIWPARWGVNLGWNEILTLSIHPVQGVGLLLLLLAFLAPNLVRRIRPTLSARGIAAYFLGLGGVLAWQHEPVLQALAWRDGGWVILFPLFVLLQAAICLALVFTCRRQPRTVEYYSITALAALSLGSLPQYFPMADSWHILWSLAPAFGLFVFALQRWTRWAAPVVAMGLAAALLPSVVTKIRSAPQALAHPMITLVNPPFLRGMKVSPQKAQSVGQITDTLEKVQQHRSEIPCALFGNEALFLCFASNRTNPSPYFVTWAELADKAANQQRWNYISSVRPLLFLHKAKWGAVNDFYLRSSYVPLAYVAEEALEIAVPKELADVMGVSAYGTTPRTRTARAPAPP